MDNNRLTKHVFNNDYATSATCNNWCSDVKHIMHSIGIVNHYHSKTVVNLSQVRETIKDIFADKWSQDILQAAKLRTYRVFKLEFKCYAFYSEMGPVG